MIKHTDSGGGGCACTTLVLLLVVNLLIGGFATEYVAEFWSAYFGHPKDLPFWIAAVAGLFLGEITIPLAILTWIFSWMVA